jgi:hypothetical protein
MEAIATKETHGEGCGLSGGPIGGVYGAAFYRTPAGYTAEKKTRRKRNRGYQGLLSVAHQPLPPSPFLPHTARLLHCLGAALSGHAPPIVHPMDKN